MIKSNFSEEFKRDAVRQITERGYPVAEVSQRLGVPGASGPHTMPEVAPAHSEPQQPPFRCGWFAAKS